MICTNTNYLRDQRDRRWPCWWPTIKFAAWAREFRRECRRNWWRAPQTNHPIQIPCPWLFAPRWGWVCLNSWKQCPQRLCQSWMVDTAWGPSARRGPREASHRPTTCRLVRRCRWTWWLGIRSRLIWLHSRLSARSSSSRWVSWARMQSRPLQCQTRRRARRLQRTAKKT